MNPLIITNVLLAVIAGCMVLNIVGPSVEPRVQAAQEAKELKTAREWWKGNVYALISETENDPNPNTPYEYLFKPEDFNDEVLVTEDAFLTALATMIVSNDEKIKRMNQAPRWELIQFRAHRMIDLMLKIEENTATIAENTSR